MQRVEVGTSRVYLDAMMTGPAGEPLVLSFFERSAQMARSAGAGLVLEGTCVIKNRMYCNKNLFRVQYAAITQGKERFTHGLAVAVNLEKDYLITTQTDLYADLYALLMNRYALPLLEWWMPELMDRMLARGFLRRSFGSRILGDHTRTVKKNGQDVALSDLQVYALQMKEEDLVTSVSRLIQEGKIWITKKAQKRLDVENMDDYFQKYGKSIVDNLKKILHPVSEFNSKIDRCALMTMRLYPQQAAMANGVFTYLKGKRKGSVLFCMGTGTGKTIQAAAAAEMLYVDQWLRKNPGKTLADAYAGDGVVNYRHIIMAPGHMVEKWKKEITREIPYAKAVIVDTFKQLVDLKAGGRERRFGKEYYIISKDFLKLSYQKMPTPKREGVKNVEFFMCADCHSFQMGKPEACGFCGSKKLYPSRSIYKRHGMLCPNCGRLLFKAKQLDVMAFENTENDSTYPLQWYDMAAEKQDNQYCVYCGTELWMPFVKNLTLGLGEPKKPAWVKQTFWANKAKRGKVTNWVLRGHEQDASEVWGECTNSMDDLVGGCRKYSPALYIKKQLKGFFDVFIMDEVHKAKGGATAQGNAFHSIIKSSRYTFGLTGTIAGGMATDLYYLLFRLNPSRMIDHGYQWGSVMKYAEDYGCVETQFTANLDPRMNVMSKGRQLQSPKVIPGISPLVFSEFLLDQAVFLDISDMSEHMPPLYERIELCSPQREMEQEMQWEYFRILKRLKDYEKDMHVPLSSIRNQFAMSYLDKPYGAEPIKDPKDGGLVAVPCDYHALIEDGGLLAKEERLLEIVKEELKEGRRCVIYAEYSQSEATNVLPRLREIILDACGLQPHEVVAMYAGYPQASRREAWMHKRAEDGMKVMLCNPRLCETGLDFCWRENGNVYNYPTLIFYQCGYSLYVTWQAAGRSWRLNQREECRTYYLAYEKTVQQAILQVLGEKKAATAAIQGRFSAEGLAAMARGVDTQVRLAQIMSEIDQETGNHLQQMFDAVTGTAGECSQTEKMKIFSELVKVVEKAEEAGGFEKLACGSIFDAFSRMRGTQACEDSKSDQAPFLLFKMLMNYNELGNGTETRPISGGITEKRKTRRRRVSYGTCSILEL